MKYALNMKIDAGWNAARAAAAARTAGFEGIDLHPADGAAIDWLEAQAEALKQSITDGGSAIAALQWEIQSPVTKSQQKSAEQGCWRGMDLAIRLGCPLLRIAIVQSEGRDRGVLARRFADWFGPLGDRASTQGLTLALENGPPFRTSRDVWTFLETLGHPAVGVCLCLEHLRTVSESPWVAVPTLSHRIAHVDLGKSIGQDDLRILLTRLKGIGYGGFAAIRLADDATDWADQMKQLKSWFEPPAEAKAGKADVKAEKKKESQTV